MAWTTAQGEGTCVFPAPVVCNIQYEGRLMKPLAKAVAAGIAALALAGSAQAYEAFKGPLGLLQKSAGTCDGYTLVAPQSAKITYLIDMDGKVINEWKSDYIGFYAELMPNGNLIRHSVVPDAWPAFGGMAGLLEEFDWSGKKVWEHKIFTPGKEVSHHTFEVMPNGNILVLVWKYRSYEEAVAKGLAAGDPVRTLHPEGMKHKGRQLEGVWPDAIREIEHGTGKTVWEWDVWDHVGTGPDQLDINKYVFLNNRAWAGPDWTHFNGVAYNPATNEVAFTSRNLSEVYVIDYKTDKGIKYRWGNPANYGEGRAPGGYGDDGSQKLFGPHAPDWTPQGTISILDNGHTRPSGNYTRAVELDPKKSVVVWQWKASNIDARDWNFYSASQCGAQKLPNGNWLITASNTGGHVIEVLPDKRIVWEFINPMGKDGKVYASSGAYGNMNELSVHKAMRYGRDDPRFKGRDMSVKHPLMPEGTPDWVKLLRINSMEAGFSPEKK